MTRAEKVIKFIETFCLVPEGAQVGKPLVLADFQKKFIRDIYDNPNGTRHALMSVSRKNGKSGLIAALLLTHLVGPEAKANSQLVSGAMSRDQAALVFNLAAKMVTQSEKLSRLVRIIPSGKRLIGLNMNTEYKALAADGKTAHGLSPVFAVLDEVGQVRGPQSDFIDAITTSQGAHESPLLITISTQAATDADLLSIWLDDAIAGNDPHTVCHLYSAEKDCDLMDEKQWKKANPALGLFRSYDDMRSQMEKAERMPSMANTARNLLLNQRVSLESPFVSADVWAQCKNAPMPLSGVVYAGLDLSQRKDLTAFVLISKENGIWNVHPHFWTPAQGLDDRERSDRAPYRQWVREGLMTACPGATVDYERVAKDIADLCKDLDIQAIAFDRWRITELKKELDRIGCELPFVEWGQGFKDMAPALDALEAELLNGRVAHGNNGPLTFCAANAVAIGDPAGNRKLDKSRGRRSARIDGMQALAMAMGVAARTEIIEEPFLEVLMA